MAITRRSFLAGLGSVSVGLLFRRQLDAVLDSLERDLAVEPVSSDQLPSAAEIVVQPLAGFRPQRLVIAGVVVGKRVVPETTFEPCASCDGEGDDDALCDVCEGLGGTYVETGKLVERDVHHVPWVIEDITIGSHRQIADEIPGDMFSSSAVDSLITMDTAAPGTQIRFRVRYVGEDPRGARFTAALVGTDVDGRRCVLPIDSGGPIVA